MKKLVLITLIFIVVVWGAVSYFLKQDTAEEPSVDAAPFLIRLTGRDIYTAKFSGNSPNITVQGYWTWDGKRWKQVKGILPLSGMNVEVVRRSVK